MLVLVIIFEICKIKTKEQLYTFKKNDCEIHNDYLSCTRKNVIFIIRIAIVKNER